LKAVTLFLILSFSVGCTSISNDVNDHLRKKYEIGGHYANHCGGVNVPICKTWIEGVERDKTREQTMWGIKTFGEYLIKELITGRNQ
jgi:hypothetical protein